MADTLSCNILMCFVLRQLETRSFCFPSVIKLTFASSFIYLFFFCQISDDAASVTSCQTGVRFTSVSVSSIVPLLQWHAEHRQFVTVISSHFYILLAFGCTFRCRIICALFSVQDADSLLQFKEPRASYTSQQPISSLSLIITVNGAMLSYSRRLNITVKINCLDDSWGAGAWFTGHIIAGN